MLKRFIISLSVLGSLVMQTGLAQQFFSTQFSPVEEQAKFREILAAGGFDFASSEEGPCSTRSSLRKRRVRVVLM
ncbi:MAG: hypothetical protein R2865_03850 [Deinococcales bacterium]